MADGALDEILEFNSSELDALPQHEASPSHDVPMDEDVPKQIFDTNDSKCNVVSDIVYDNEEVVPLGITRRYCRKVYLDLVGPTIESVDSFTGAAISRDADTNYPEAGLLRDKTPSSVLA